MKRSNAIWVAVGIFAATGLPLSVTAHDLFVPGLTQSLGSDRRASQVGDTVTVVIVQAAEASSTLQTGRKRSTGISGAIRGGSLDESGSLSMGQNFDGRGELRRSERFVTQMSASVTDVMPNGDLVIGGRQKLDVNGEATLVEVRGRVRQADVDSENRVPSNRIADAQINYDGKGFVSRSAKPGLIQKMFGILGL